MADDGVDDVLYHQRERHFACCREQSEQQCADQGPACLTRNGRSHAGSVHHSALRGCPRRGDTGRVTVPVPASSSWSMM